MHNDDLKQLLKSAEAGSRFLPLAPAMLVGRVYESQRKQRRRRRIALSIVPIAFVLVGFGFSLQRFLVTAPPPVDAVAIVPSIAEGIERTDVSPLTLGGDDPQGLKPMEKSLEQLQLEVTYHRLVAQKIQTQRRLEANAADFRGPDPIDLAEEVKEVTAYRMLLRADALRSAMRPQEEAVAIYRDVVRLFSTTRSADLARQRLVDLGVSERDV